MEEAMPRRFKLRLISAIALAVTVIAPIGAHATTGPRSAAVGTVGHEGRWFTDAQGRVLIFHGADIDLTAFDASKDPALMQSLGFNSVKIYVPGASIQP